MRKYITIATTLVFLVVIGIPTLIVLNLEKPKVRVEVNTGVRTVRVKFHQTGQVKIMPLEDYLVGVVAAEMPANFHLEALKAQAVAARTYALKKMELAGQKNGHNPHPDADVCTDPSHCQGWLSARELKERWGLLGYLKLSNKIETAVKETEGLVVTYNGRLIDPVYHSTSGGRTENSEDVWNFKIPYLRSVDSPWEKGSPRYYARFTFSLGQIDQLLGTNLRAVPVSTLAQKNNNYLKVLAYSSSGRVKLIKVGDKVFKGTDFRRLLGLNSTTFSWQVEGDKITFTTRGYGHGVGLSQYGANGMAWQGKNYKDILTYYYTGVKIVKYGQKD